MAIVTLTHENFDDIINTNELVLIDFWAEWCEPCKSFATIFKKTAKDYPEIIFGQVDIEQETELAEDFNVRSIPLLMVLNQGVVVFSESGVIPASGLSDLIRQAQQLDMTEVLESIKKDTSPE